MPNPVAHPVRIARPRPRPDDRMGPGRPTLAGGGAVPNVGGRRRATRQFVAFSVPLAAMYIFFLAAAAGSTDPGVRTNAVLYGSLTIFLLAILGVLFVLTIGRTPRSVRIGPDGFDVEGFGGRWERFPELPGRVVTLLERYRPGPFGSERTELIRVSDPDGRERTYLVEAGLIPLGTGPVSAGNL